MPEPTRENRLDALFARCSGLTEKRDAVRKAAGDYQAGLEQTIVRRVEELGMDKLTKDPGTLSSRDQERRQEISQLQAAHAGVIEDIIVGEPPIAVAIPENPTTAQCDQAGSQLDDLAKKFTHPDGTNEDGGIDW